MISNSLHSSEDGIVGRTFYYSSTTNCEVSSLQGHILNCGNQEDGDDFIYKWTKPGGECITIILIFSIENTQ